MTETSETVRLPPLPGPVRLGVLISGSGTTLDNFIARITEGTLRAEIATVIASRPDAGGIEKARRAGLNYRVIPRREHSSTRAFSDAIFDVLRKARVDLVTLAGFLSLIDIPDDFRWKVMNIHPALIPAFCGKGFFGHHVHEAVLAKGAKVSGCTVHFADNVYDHGPIILQKCVPVHDDDTPDQLAKRVFAAECDAYPEAIRQFASGNMLIRGTRVCWKDSSAH